VVKLEHQARQALALSEAGKHDLVNCNGHEPRQRHLKRLVVEHRDTQQRQAEQNEINRDAKQVDGLSRIQAGSGCCCSWICEQDQRESHRGGKKKPGHVHGPPGERLGTENFLVRTAMMHWAHAFCVAARPSLDLSPPHAANTRVPFYTATGRKQSVPAV